MTEVLYYKPCSTCHNADCVWMGGQDTHKKCEDYQSLEQKTDNQVKTELEQIKARIELEKLGYPPSAGYYKAIMKVLEIIEKAIKEQDK